LGLKEECAVAGIFGHQECSHLLYLCLFALQHRGQEACGIVTLNNQTLYSHKSFGLVGDSFSEEKLKSLDGAIGVGHNRYSTHGGRSLQNIQPFYFKSSFGQLAMAHNGNITNAQALRSELEAAGSIFQSSSDTEVFMHLIARARMADLDSCIVKAMSAVRGAYSLVIASENALYAARDAFGFRPLVLGKKEASYVIVSESCALDLIGAEYVREIKPGELLRVDKDGLHTIQALPVKQSAQCSFEPIYFSRPDSVVFSEHVYEIRKNLGKALAREDSIDVDIVAAVPDSGVPMAMGYAQEKSIPYEIGLVRNHYIGRTFIEPTQRIRDFGVKLKLNPIPSVIKGKRIVIIDDSLVRGTTSKKIIRMIRQAGATEVHLRIASPPITDPCYFGVDTPQKDQLMAAQMSVDAIAKELGADSLVFLSQEGLEAVLADQKPEKKYCYGCFGQGYKELIG
jgi:amidophosphoribosyltransferase